VMSYRHSVSRREGVISPVGARLVGDCRLQELLEGSRANWLDSTQIDTSNGIPTRGRTTGRLNKMLGATSCERSLYCREANAQATTTKTNA